MSTHVRHQHRQPRPRATAAGKAAGPETISRIAVGIDGYPEARDAATLAEAIASATDAESCWSRSTPIRWSCCRTA
jgi:hypothetical protein